jgi:hypothetical protein
MSLLLKSSWNQSLHIPNLEPQTPRIRSIRKFGDANQPMVHNPKAQIQIPDKLTGKRAGS